MEQKHNFTQDEIAKMFSILVHFVASGPYIDAIDDYSCIIDTCTVCWEDSKDGYLNIAHKELCAYENGLEFLRSINYDFKNYSSNSLLQTFVKKDTK